MSCLYPHCERKRDVGSYFCGEHVGQCPPPINFGNYLPLVGSRITEDASHPWHRKLIRGRGMKTGELRIGVFVRVDGEQVIVQDKAGRFGALKLDTCFLDARACLGCGAVEVEPRPDGQRTCSADCEALRVKGEWQKRELERNAERAKRDDIYKRSRY